MRLAGKTRGLTHAIRASGRPQLERLIKIVRAIDEVAASPRVAAHPEVEEIAEVLDKGKVTLGKAIEELTPLVEAWEAEVLEVAGRRRVPLSSRSRSPSAWRGDGRAAGQARR